MRATCLFVDGVIGLVDYGMVGRLDHDRRISFLRYVTGLMSGDVRTQVLAVRDLGAFARCREPNSSCN